MSAHTMPTASMPSWEEARPTFSSWGAVYRHEGWTLAVVDPRVPVEESRERVAVLEEWLHWRSYRRLWLALAAAFTLACALLIGGSLVVDNSGMAVLVTAGATIVLPVVGIPAVTARRKLLRGRPHPADLVLRGDVDAALWRLVRHLNSYRAADRDHVDAVRGLLWALAHTGPEHAERIADLAGRFDGWSEHEAAVIRRATAQLWIEHAAPRRPIRRNHQGHGSVAYSDVTPVTSVFPGFLGEIVSAKSPQRP